eukprot:4406952-Pleurochrysis_carterae.AAC.1
MMTAEFVIRNLLEIVSDLISTYCVYANLSSPKFLNCARFSDIISFCRQNRKLFVHAKSKSEPGLIQIGRFGTIPAPPVNIRQDSATATTRLLCCRDTCRRSTLRANNLTRRAERPAQP